MPRRELLLSVLFFILFAAFFAANESRAQPPLPYDVRTHSYNGFNTGALGDNRTVGMGGATLGLGDTFIAGASNPAGLAMTLDIADFNFTSDSVHDGHVQDYDNSSPKMTALGVAMAVYPWGFSMGFVPIGSEGQTYTLANGQAANLLVETHEFRLAASRLFFNNRLSLGASINIGIGEQEIQTGATDDDRHAAGIGATLGAMIQLPSRFLLSAAYTSPMHYAISGQSALLPGFFQDIDVPSRFGLGLGWIPNRFIRGDAQALVVGETHGAALLSNDTSAIGTHYTFQPKFGLAYIFLDFDQFRGTIFGGSYYEDSRIEGATNRWHGTVGIEGRAWIFTAGIGTDRASQYKNTLFSIGIDLARLLGNADLIPTGYRPSGEGILPNPFFEGEDGLPRPLRRHWSPYGGKDLNPVEVLENLPKAVQKNAGNLTDVQRMTQ